MRASRILRRTLASMLDDVHAARLDAVFQVVEGLLRGRKLSCVALGRALPGSAKAKHNIKKVDRLLGNRHLHGEQMVFYAAIAQLLLSGEDQPTVLVDWTKLGEGQWALAAAVATDGRALPLYVEVHPERLLSDRKTERRFLAALGAVLPASCQPLIVTDAGFRNPWFRAVRERGWHFLGRVSSNVLLHDGRRWRAALRVWKTATSRPRSLGEHTVAKTNPIAARLVLYQGKPKGRKHCPRDNPRASEANRKSRQRVRTPWLLITSLKRVPARQIVRLYQSRMQTEELFRDTKNHRFGWSFEDACSRSCKRLEILLLIGALATLATSLVGRWAESCNLHLDYQANTTKTRRVLSHFVLGAHIIARGLAQIRIDTLRQALIEVRDIVRRHSLQEAV